MTDGEVTFTEYGDRVDVCDIAGKAIRVSLGTEHEVDILADTLSNHIIVSRESVAVVVLHNHPSTQTFSLQDIHFFIRHPMIEVIVVVSNQGTIHYLKRDIEYDYKKSISVVSGVYLRAGKGLSENGDVHGIIDIFGKVQ